MVSKITKITKDTTLAEILKFKNTEKILVKYKVPCLGCPMAAFEFGMLKIEDVARMYKIDIKNLLRELNENIKQKQR